MSIRLIANNDLPFKSISKSFDISGLPDFTVLLGVNGSGKSQLLEIVSNPVDGIQRGTIFADNEQVDNSAVLRITDWTAGDAPEGTLSSIQNARQQVANDVQNSLRNRSGALSSESISYAYVQRQLLNKLISDFSSQDYGYNNMPSVDMILEKIPDSFFDYTQNLFNEKVGDVIVSMQIDALQEGDISRPNKAIEEFNSLCNTFKLDFSISKSVNLKQAYRPVLLRNKKEIRWSELSSGEMVLFRILCWMFNYAVTSKEEGFPRVMLLDEPDAHLNPGMIRQIVDIFEKTLVDRIGTKVIMTTHSPNTVAIVNETTLRYLRRDTDEAVLIDEISKRDATELLSDGLVFVNENQKMVFTEDKQDAEFYDLLYRNGVQDKHLNNYPAVLFIPSSKARSTGSCEEVKKLVATFKDLDIEKSIKGIVDFDDGRNKGLNQIYSGERYSIENYLYDPFVIGLTCIRLGESSKLSVDGVIDGDYLAVIKNKELRQVVTDKVSELVENHATSLSLTLDTAKVEVSWFIRGYKTPVKLKVSKWVIAYRGHDVQGKLMAGNGCPFQGMSTSECMKTMRFVSLLPKDLQQAFSEVMK